MSRIEIIFYLLLIFVLAVEAQFVNGDFSDTLDGPFDGFGWEWYENDIDTCDHGAACDLHDSLNTCTPTYTGDFVSSPMCGYVYSGETGYCGDGGLVQTVTVPSTTPVYLHFWFKHKADSWGGRAVIILDEGPIVDNDSNYYILASHRFPGGVGGGPTPWMERIINVSPWAGRTVNIRVALWDKSTHWCNMGDHSNWVWVDDFFFYSPGVLPADLFYPETLRFDPTASCEFLPFRIGARAFNYGVSGTIDSIQAHLFLPDGLALDDPLTVRQWLNPPSLYPDSSGDVFWNVHADGTVLDTTVCFEIMFVYIAGDSFIMSDTILYESDFELDDGGLVSSAPAGWQWGVPVGPPGAHSGTKCWGTVIGGDYDGGSHNWDLTLSVDLRSLSTTDRAELIFWHWYELPITYSDTTDWSIDHVYDGGNVCASTDGGATWFNISGGGYWVDLLGSTGWGSGRLTGWQRVECDLSMLVGHTVLLRFRFANDATDNDYAGWYIDDVRVIAHKASTPIPYPDTTIVSGCIFIPPVVYADAGDDVTICYGERAIIGGSPSADKGAPPYTYIWTPAAGLNNPSSPNPIASPDTTTQYILTVIDSVNCIDEDTVLVTVKYPVIDSVWFWEETDCNDSNIVHICYTLSNCEANISVWMSADSGETWTPAGSSWFVTLLDTAGDIGANITLGTHCFEWVMSEDLPGVEDSSFEVMVIANRVKETAETTYLAVPGKACPYFAGQPSGVSVHSTHDGIDSTPTHSPVCIPVPDCVDFFEIAATGSTLFYHGTPNIPPDSRDGPPPVPSPTVIDPADGYDDFGISTFDGAGMCALLGVFLDTIPPDPSATPPSLDTIVHNPELQQLFFIGSGPIIIVPPDGAIQLCFGVNDCWQWNDNVGHYDLTVIYHGCGTTFVIADTASYIGPLDSRPPRVEMICPAETVFYRDTGTFNWLVDDMFPNATVPSSLFIHYCDNIDTFITFDDSVNWPVPAMNCSDAYAVVAVPDSFCNWGYDTCEFVILCDTLGPVATIVRPFDGAYSSCEDEHIIMVIHDDDGVDPATIRLVVEGHTYSVDDPELTFRNDTLIYYPAQPFEDNQTINVCLIEASDIHGNSLRHEVCWSFTMDFSPPWFELLEPKEFMVPDNQQDVVIAIGDSASGVDENSIEFRVVGGESYDFSELNWTYVDSIRGGVLSFIPESFGLAFPAGESVCVQVSATDTTDYCADNFSDTVFCFLIEPETFCKVHPNPFTPNGDGINDYAIFDYPKMFRLDAELSIYDLKDVLVYRRKLNRIGRISDFLSRSWDGRDNEGNKLPPGLYIWVIIQRGEVICTGTVVLAR